MQLMRKLLLLDIVLVAEYVRQSSLAAAIFQARCGTFVFNYASVFCSCEVDYIPIVGPRGYG